MNGLIFARPEWLWGFGLLIPLVVLRLWSHLRTARHLPGLVSPRLSHRLINGANQARRWVVFVLQALALACLFAALARPQRGFEEVETEIDARNLLVAIDTSRSMMSDDLPPHRLERAKLAAKDIVLSLPEDRIGLLAFAGKPFLQAPLTVDHEAVLEAIDQLDTEIIPRGGTNLSAAVSLALDTVKEAKVGPSALVLFSDGEALEGIAEIEQMRDRASAAGLSILTVGVGTVEGSIIPEIDEDGNLVPGAFVKDETGKVVRTRLTPEPLQALASKGGAYVHLGGSASLSRVVEQIRNGIASSREDGEKTRKPIEQFLWPLSSAFVLLVLSHLVPLLWLKPSARRATLRNERNLAAAGAVLLLLPAPLPAADPLLNGRDAFLKQDFPGALAAYEGSLAENLTRKARSRLQMGIGAAAYRLGDFERAAEAYGSALAEGDDRVRRESHYNLGNTLFRRGEAALQPAPSATADPDQVQALSAPGDAMGKAIRDWEASIEHFESSLALDPGNSQTTHNRDYVRKRLDELKEQQKQQQEQEKQQQKDEEKKEEEKKDQEKEDQEKQDDGKNQENSPGRNPPGEEPKDPKEDPGDRNPDKQPQDPGENPDKPKDPGESKEEKPGNEPPENPGEAPPQEPEKPNDGKLEANPNQSQPDQPTPGQPQPDKANPADLKPNPRTGYSPSEARGLLDALADETEVRPLLQPARGEKFKNW